MKSIKNIAVATIIFLGIWSCGNNENKTQNGNDINIDAVINSKSKDPNAKGENKCLLNYQNKYDALLSENEVLTTTGFGKEKLETKYNKVLKNAEHHEFVYKFKNGRKGKVLGIKREMELPDIVSVRSISPMSLSTFNQSYQAVSDEQMNAAKDAVNDIAEGNSGNADADEALKKAEEQNLSKEQINKTGGEILDVMKDVSKGFQTVENLADAAVWNTITNELIVLQNGVKFEVRVDISNDKEKNKTVAMQLAQIVLNKCK